MRTASIILTIALIIPIAGNVFYAYSYYAMSSHGHIMTYNKTIMFTNYVPAFIFDFMAVLIAIILNVNRKYLVNTVMCATLVGGYILHSALYYVFLFISTWLK